MQTARRRTRRRPLPIGAAVLALVLGPATMIGLTIALALLANANEPAQRLDHSSIDIDTPRGPRMITFRSASSFGREFYHATARAYERRHYLDAGVDVGPLGHRGIPRWVLDGPLDWIWRAEPPPETRIVMAIGWPLPCLWCEMAATNPTGRPIQSWEPIRALKIADRPAPLRGPAPMPVVLPYCVAVIPLVLNLAAFIAGVFILQLAFIRVRRYSRAWRGLCPHCAYDLRGTPAGDPCSECGHTSRRISAPSPATPAPVRP